MITLAFDTSTAVGSVAWLEDDQLKAERTFGRDGLFPALAALKPDLRTVDLIAVGVGPGSFTGIRVAIAAAKGLALPGGQPVKAAGSFDALAGTVAPAMPADCARMCVLGDARRGEIYYALYDRAGRPSRECRIAMLESLADEVREPVWFVSSEIERYRESLQSALGGLAVIAPAPAYPSAAAVGRLARQRFLADGRGDDRLTPLYLRTPQYKTL